MSFDRLASHYRWMETVLAGDLLQRCRTAHLEALPWNDVHDVLMLGEGPGRLLGSLRARLPDAQFTVIDSSAGMLGTCRDVVGNGGTTAVQFEHADLLGHAFPMDAVDLVTTPFVLDCFTADQLAQLIPRVASAIKPGGHWLIADFAIPPSGWRRTRARAIHSLMYGFFRNATALPARAWTDPDDCLRACGLRRLARTEFSHGLLRSDLWQR